MPCEDLGVLILDSPEIQLTQASLVAAADGGAAVILCGRDHHPSALLLPMFGNTTHTERLADQISANAPLKKRLWQQIVKAKLLRQAMQLAKGEPARVKLLSLREGVRSGDTDNREAQGARWYWPALFKDEKFRREREGLPPNNLLNYGYMVLRATVARAVCCAGLHPAIGLHHHHRENPFCLADDLMEPFRPMIDNRVATLHFAGKKELDREAKEMLLGALAETVTLKGGQGPLFVAAQKTAASLCACFSGEAGELDLPL